jgi:polar amino acid transport system substrate-binding protein
MMYPIHLRNLQQLPDVQRQGLRAALLVLAAWDGNLWSHSDQVARKLLALAPHGDEEEWYWAGLLHDIGKITVPLDILHKRGGLSRRERKVVQQHALEGAAILNQIGATQTIIDGAKFHHERWDGRGYPFDLGGEQIPFVARVLGVVDAFSAMTSGRLYRPALPLKQARLEVERHAGTQFDPQVVQRFLLRMRDEG